MGCFLDQIILILCPTQGSELFSGAVVAVEAIVATWFCSRLSRLLRYKEP
jgi:hypothetical protein